MVSVEFLGSMMMRLQEDVAGESSGQREDEGQENGGWVPHSADRIDRASRAELVL